MYKVRDLQLTARLLAFALFRFKIMPIVIHIHETKRGMKEN
jgi:hypothetical protein